MRCKGKKPGETRPHRAHRDAVALPASVHRPHSRLLVANLSSEASRIDNRGTDVGPKSVELSPRDPFGIILQLTQKLALEQYDYELRCDLVEPKQSSEHARQLGVTRELSINSIAHLSLVDIRLRLSNSRRSKHSLLDLVDMLHLESVMVSLFQPTSQFLRLGDIDLKVTDIPLDHLALAFATLALGDFPNLVDAELVAFLDLSMCCTENYAGKSTFELAITLLIQHACILRTATSNRSRALIIHAVQVAHDLGINRGALLTNTPLQASKFYLLLYFADQYCAMTYNTPPCIKPDEYTPDLFRPLVQKYPHLISLIDLLMLNAKIFSSLHQSSLAQETILSLESSIGEICCKIGRASQGDRNERDLFMAQYSTLARIHMFWARVMLRAPLVVSPLVVSPQYWLCSLTVCLRSSQMLLAIYLDIFGPAIKVLSCASVPPDPDIKQRLRENIKLPPTWRQVHRIATSILIIMYGFWKGEVSYDEAARYCACALLLLEFQRIRWTSSLNQIVTTVKSIAFISHLDLRKSLKDILPSGNDAFIDCLINDHRPDIQYGTGLDNVHNSIIHTGTQLDQQPDPFALLDWEQDMALFTSVPYPDFSAFI